MLIACDGQDPSSHCLAMDSLGLPRTPGLLGRSLMFCRHTLIRSSTSIAYQVAADHLVARQLGASGSTTVGSRLDDLVALLGDAVVEILHQLLERGEDGSVRHRDSLEDSEHGGDRSRRLTRWVPVRVSDDDGDARADVPIARLGGVRYSDVERLVMNLEGGDDLAVKSRPMPNRVCGRCRWSVHPIAVQCLACRSFLNTKIPWSQDVDIMMVFRRP